MHAPEDRSAEADNASVVVHAAELLIRLGGVLSALLILVIFGIVIYAISQRYLLDTPLLWGDELIGYLLVPTVMFGAAEALRRDDHIAIDLLTRRAGDTGRLVLGVLSSLSVIAFAAIVGWSAWGSIQFARAFGSYSVGYIEIETWIPQVPLVIGSVLLAVAAAARLLRLFARGKSQ